jgi:hypothetical protein
MAGHQCLLQEVVLLCTVKKNPSSSKPMIYFFTCYARFQNDLTPSNNILNKIKTIIVSRKRTTTFTGVSFFVMLSLAGNRIITQGQLAPDSITHPP